nr:hypothetical protein [Tanacetum cinerariifolium]
MTFTNRLGRDIYVKLSSEDPPKLLRASDVRVSFVCLDTEGPSKLQIRAEGTDWSFPVKIEKEDTIFLVLKKEDGTQDILRTEIRVYISTRRIFQNVTVIFVLLPDICKSVIDRIENRTTSKIVRFCQSGINDAVWIRLEPHASTKFSWVDPYGQKGIDTETTESRSDGLGRSLVSFENWKIANMPNTEQKNSSPLELIVELGVVGVSLVDHRPKELCYLYLERVFISYSTGYDGGTTSRLEFYPIIECIEFCGRPGVTKSGVKQKLLSILSMFLEVDCNIRSLGRGSTALK